MKGSASTFETIPSLFTIHGTLRKGNNKVDGTI